MRFLVIVYGSLPNHQIIYRCDSRRSGATCVRVVPQGDGLLGRIGRPRVRWIQVLPTQQLVQVRGISVQGDLGMSRANHASVTFHNLERDSLGHGAVQSTT